MKRELYVVTYDNMHYCGGELNCLAWATSNDDAICVASDHMEEAQRELFSDHYEEDENVDMDDTFVGSCRAELVKGSEFEEFINMKDQESFYPVVNPEKANE